MDVSVDSIVSLIIADNSLVVIPLPDWDARTIEKNVDILGGIHLEITNDHGNRHTAAGETIGFFGMWREFMNCRYCYGIFFDDHNPMKMIGHNHCLIERDVGVTPRERLPDFPYNLSSIIQAHFAIRDFSEQVLALIGDHRDKICAGLGVIIVWQTE